MGWSRCHPGDHRCLAVDPVDPLIAAVQEAGDRLAERLSTSKAARSGSAQRCFVGLWVVGSFADIEDLLDG